MTRNRKVWRERLLKALVKVVDSNDYKRVWPLQELLFEINSNVNKVCKINFHELAGFFKSQRVYDIFRYHNDDGALPFEWEELERGEEESNSNAHR